MARATGRQKLVSVIALLAAIYFLLILTPASNNYTKYVDRVASWYTNYFQGSNVTVVQTTGVQKAEVTKVSVGNEGSISNIGHADRCNYKVQVFGTGNMIIRNGVLADILKHSKTVGRHVHANVTCPSYDCDIQVTIADDKNKFANMDAVLLHVLAYFYPKPLPRGDMNPNQTLLFASWEAPRSLEVVERGNFKQFYIDATWTYNRVSDITHPYGCYIPNKPTINQTKSVDEWLKGKTKLIAWMASNCDFTGWPRLQFVKELQKFIPVDVYGRCGNLTCQPKFSPECTVDLMRQYKFYLALENAECEDYITEKVWLNSLMQGVVPIVYGPRRKIYEELLPPNSFIYVADYNSIKELAQYLKLLDSKPELYVRYLEWQYKGSILSNSGYIGSVFCDLIPAIEKKKKGKLKRTPLTDSKFYQSCRKAGEFEAKSTAFGLNKWNPW